MGDDAQITPRVLVDAFGEFSDSSDEALSPTTEEDKLYIWKSVEGIDGLWLCCDFLPEKHQNLLLSAIRKGRLGLKQTGLCGNKLPTKGYTCNLFFIRIQLDPVAVGVPIGYTNRTEGWFHESSHNQAMRFGDLPEWATELTRLVRKAICFAEVVPVDIQKLDCKDQLMEESGPFPFDLLWREPLFDQLIANVYQPGEGICAHIDLMRFEDGIAIVSMESECVMHFSRAHPDTHSHTQEGEDYSLVNIPVFLNPGSLIMMYGEARYCWKHEINRKTGFQNWKGNEIFQRRRTSITLRKLRHLSSDC